MGITVDLGNFTDSFERLKDRAEALPKVLMQEAAVLEEHALKIHAPYRLGALKSSIYPEDRGWSILIAPHTIYARKVQFVGKSRGYIERGAAGAEPLLQPALNARAQEYLLEGR